MSTYTFLTCPCSEINDFPSPCPYHAGIYDLESWDVAATVDSQALKGWKCQGCDRVMFTITGSGHTCVGVTREGNGEQE